MIGLSDATVVTLGGMFSAFLGTLTAIVTLLVNVKVQQEQRAEERADRAAGVVVTPDE